MNTNSFIWFRSKVAKFLLASLPANLASRIQIPYFLALSRLNGFVRTNDSIKSVESSGGVYRVNFNSNHSLLVPQVERISRFVSGIDRAKDRILQQYQFHQLSSDNIRTVLDIGANIGEFSLAFLEKNKSQVFAFEPVLENYQCLVENLQTYVGRSSCFNVALGNIDGQVNFHIADSLQNSSAIEPDTTYSIKTVKMMTIKTFLSNHPSLFVDLLKMDAEGFEPEILDGIGDTLPRIRNFSIDCSPERQGRDTSNFVIDYLSKNSIPNRTFSDNESKRIIVIAGRDLKND